MSKQSDTQYGLTVKEATSRVYPFIEGMNLVMNILDQLNMKGVSTVEELEQTFFELREYRKLRHPSQPLGLLRDMNVDLLRAITKWCRVKGIVTAEDFTSKVGAMKSGPN
jgi:hypothetical protein